MNTTTTKTVAQFIADHGITMDTTRIPGRQKLTGAWAKNASHWHLTLRRGGNGTGKGPETAIMVSEYSMGSAHKGRPDLADVLDSMVSDCSDLPAIFEDWAENMGYDTDSREAMRIFDACCLEYRELREFLGPQLFAELLETDRL